MTASLSGVFNLQSFTDLGALMAGGRLYTYAPSTTTQKTAYTDAAGSVAHTYTNDGLGGQYVALNSRGELPAPLFLTSGGYDITLKTSAGVTVWTRRAIGGDDASTAAVSALQTNLADGATAGKGTTLLGWLRAATAAVATTLKSWLGWQEINAFEFMTVAQIADFQAGAMTLDLAAPLQAWVDACSTLGQVGRLGKGTAKITTPLAVAAGVILRGHGPFSRLAPWGCDAIRANGDLVTVEDMALFGYSAVGVADPKTFSAIKSTGVGGAVRNYITLRGLYLQGWLHAANLEYTSSSTVDNVTTVNSTNGVRYFGQCVNNQIIASELVVTGGASVLTVKDGAFQGEGLQISSTLMAGGLNGLKSDGFLSIGFDASCIVDLCSGKAFDLSGVAVFKCDAQWVYSADSCFYFADVGSASETNATINVGLATCTGSANLLYWGANNNGLNVEGSLYLPNGAGYPVSLNGGGARIAAYIKNGTPQAGVRVNTTGNTIATTGDRSVEWATTPIAVVPSNNALVLPRNGCLTFNISGTTNITSISATGWNGQEVNLLFQGALTVTDGSNLKLAGNFVTTADDVLRLVCDGTNWYEISRSAN